MQISPWIKHCEPSKGYFRFHVKELKSHIIDSNVRDYKAMSKLAGARLYSHVKISSYSYGCVTWYSWNFRCGTWQVCIEVEVSGQLVHLPLRTLDTSYVFKVWSDFGHFIPSNKTLRTFSRVTSFLLTRHFLPSY